MSPRTTSPCSASRRSRAAASRRAEDIPHGPPVAVIGQRLWRSRFGGTQDIVGRAILLNGAPITSSASSRRVFRSDPDADLWLPMQADPNSTNQGHYLFVGRPVEARHQRRRGASADDDPSASDFRAANPQWMDKEESVAVVPMREATTGDVRTALWVLFGAVALVLLIACATWPTCCSHERPAGSASSRSARDGRQSRARCPSVAHGERAAGRLGRRARPRPRRMRAFADLLLLVPGNIPRVTRPMAARDRHSAARLARRGLHDRHSRCLTGIVFGLFPALQTSKPDLVSTLKEASGRSGTGVATSGSGRRSSSSKRRSRSCCWSAPRC